VRLVGYEAIGLTHEPVGHKAVLSFGHVLGKPRRVPPVKVARLAPGYFLVRLKRAKKRVTFRSTSRSSFLPGATMSYLV
jgi:hypothetical protein